MEDLEEERKFDLATARALGKVEDVLAPALSTVRPGGRLVLFKGPKWNSERTTAESVAAAEGFEIGWEREVVLPGVGRTTTFVEFHVKHAGASDRSSDRY